MELWTLAVRAMGEEETSVSIHGSREAALQCVFDNYDDEDEWSKMTDSEAALEELADAQGLVIQIEPHQLEVDWEV